MTTFRALVAVLVCWGGAASAGKAWPHEIQCAQYARDNSAIHLSRDAASWWQQATSDYTRGSLPVEGAVLLLYSEESRCHTAVVTRIVGLREIRIDHADWMDGGSIYRNVPVADVSGANDWSQVRVWNTQSGAWGGKTYPVQGFTAVSGAALPPDDRNPPPGSPFTLTAEDRAIPSPFDER